MKLNWKTFKVAFALVIIVGTLFWAVDSVRSRSYQGTHLNFAVGRGPVIVTNTSIQPVSVQLIGEGSRFFTVTSPIKGLSGSSTRQGTGNSTTQLLTFDLPFGVSEFTVVRGAATSTDVTFVASSFTGLDVSARPLDTNETNITIIVAAIVIMGSLFYISSATGHPWLNVIRGKSASTQDTRPVATVLADGGQGRPMKAYGDNRMDRSQ